MRNEAGSWLNQAIKSISKRGQSWWSYTFHMLQLTTCKEALAVVKTWQPLVSASSAFQPGKWSSPLSGICISPRGRWSVARQPNLEFLTLLHDEKYVLLTHAYYLYIFLSSLWWNSVSHSFLYDKISLAIEQSRIYYRIDQWWLLHLEKCMCAYNHLMTHTIKRYFTQICERVFHSNSWDNSATVFEMDRTKGNS